VLDDEDEEGVSYGAARPAGQPCMRGRWLRHWRVAMSACWQAAATPWVRLTAARECGATQGTGGSTAESLRRPYAGESRPRHVADAAGTHARALERGDDVARLKSYFV
jgi:hypothetical protein